MRRLLLTRGLGCINSHTAVVLAEVGVEVVLYDNLSNSKRSVLDRLETIAGVRFSFVERDVREPDGFTSEQIHDFECFSR